MANRPVFVVKNDKKNFVLKVFTEFTWFPGFSKIQKQKSIESLHLSFKKNFPNYNILEVSSKSDSQLGNNLSAFSLKIFLNDGSSIPLESAFQGSKVFERGGPYQDLYRQKPKQAKKDSRLNESGEIIQFKFFDQIWENKPETLFYDWLYLNSVYMNKQLATQIIKYDAFTDIEFNPNKSLNCQAYSAALFVSLYRLSVLNSAIQCVDNYKSTIKKGIY